MSHHSKPDPIMGEGHNNPAFPIAPNNFGLSKRELMAALILSGMGGVHNQQSFDSRALVRRAIVLADELLHQLRNGLCRFAGEEGGAACR